MSQKKSASNSQSIWITGLILSGCIGCYCIFLNNAKAIGSKMPETDSTKTTIAQAKATADGSKDNAQWIALIGLATTGGLLGWVTFLVKQLVDKKEQAIINLKEEKRILEEQKNREIVNIEKECKNKINTLEYTNKELQEELLEVTDLRGHLDKLISALKRKEIPGDIDSSISQIIEKLTKLKDFKDIQKLHHQAAERIQNKADVWLEQMVQYAEEKYPEELKGKKERFTKDIYNCLVWFYWSTFYNVPKNFEKYLPKRSINSIEPYRACFKDLRKQNDIGELNPAEASYFKEYLDKLIELL